MATMKPKTLTNQNLITLFGVTGMTIYNWRRGTPTKAPLPCPATPVEARAWAKRHGVPMTCDPRTLLGVGGAKRGPKPAVVRNAAGKLGSINARRAAA